MTEEKLSASGKTSRIRPLIGLFIALLGIPALVLWLARQPLLEMFLRQACEEQGLSCRLSVTRLDFSGVTLTSVDLRAPGAAEAGLSAGAIDVGLAWEGPLSVRAAAVSGEALAMRLDLTGGGPLAGDLDQAVRTLMKPSGGAAERLPLLDFPQIAVTAKTLWGELVASGRVSTDTDGAVRLEAAVRPVRLAGGELVAELAHGDVSATYKDDTVVAGMKLLLSELEQGASRVSDLHLDLALRQDVSAAGMAAPDGRTRTEASRPAHEAAPVGDGQADSIWTSAFWRFLPGTESLQLSARTGRGAVSGVTWTASEASLGLAATAHSPLAGTFALHLDDVWTDELAAGGVDVAGDISPTDRSVSASGRLQARGLVLSPQQRARVNAVLFDPLKAVLPQFADAAGRAIGRAAAQFEASAAWTASASSGQVLLALTDEAVLSATSGLRARFVPDKTSPSGVTVTGAAAPEWTGSGDVFLSGGGAPAVRLQLAGARLAAGGLAVDGGLEMSASTDDGDGLRVSLQDFTIAASDAKARVAGRLKLRLDGALAGGRWSGLEAGGDVSGDWDDDAFAARAPGGVQIAWTDAVYGDTRIGPGIIAYHPAGALASSGAGGLVGRGELTGASFPVAGGGFDARVRLGTASVGWQAAGAVHAVFDMQPGQADLRLDTDTILIALEDVAGDLFLDDGWRMAGSFSGGAVTSGVALVSRLTGRFDLEGQSDDVKGSLSEVTSRIMDARPGDQARYEPTEFSGRARLSGGVADFDGRLRLISPGVEIAHITGRHSLLDNTGSLVFNRTPLLFSRRTLQPSHLSRLLTGPARVNGRVDISGEAAWGHDVLSASATLDLRDVGFALASAGVFEGVSGRIDISDLFALRSEPGQTLTVDRVTFGLPIDDGRISFQLEGYDRVRIEGAQWPFLNGFIRVLPADFVFASTESNRVLVQAVDWDLSALAETLNLPDLDLEGRVGGDFPIVFSAGSAAISHAVLTSGGPGVIRYGGAVSQTVADSEPAAAIVMDALKDFRFDVLEIGLDGNLAGQMMLTMDLLGRNPAVMNGRSIALGVSIDSYLSRLLDALAPDARLPADGGKRPDGPGVGDMQRILP